MLHQLRLVQLTIKRYHTGTMGVEMRCEVAQAKQFDVPSMDSGLDEKQRSLDNPMLAALRAGQEDRLRLAAAYRESVGDPIDALTTLLPMPEGAMLDGVDLGDE